MKKKILITVSGFLFLFSLDSFTQIVEGRQVTRRLGIDPFDPPKDDGVDASKLNILFRCEDQIESLAIARLKSNESPQTTTIYQDINNRFYPMGEQTLRNGDQSEYSRPDNYVIYYFDWTSHKLTEINKKGEFVSSINCQATSPTKKY